MDREISMSVELGVGLTVLASVLTLIIFTVMLGKDIIAEATMSINETTQVVTSNYVGDIYHGAIPEVIPTATAYNIITTYDEFIAYEVNTFDTQIRNVQEDGSVLRNNLKGKVSFKLGKLINGTYYATVRPVDTDENYADVTMTGVNKFKVDYANLIDNSGD